MGDPRKNGGADGAKAPPAADEDRVKHRNDGVKPLPGTHPLNDGNEAIEEENTG